MPPPTSTSTASGDKVSQGNAGYSFNRDNIYITYTHPMSVRTLKNILPPFHVGRAVHRVREAFMIEGVHRKVQPLKEIEVCVEFKVESGWI